MQRQSFPVIRLPEMQVNVLMKFCPYLIFSYCQIIFYMRMDSLSLLRGLEAINIDEMRKLISQKSLRKHKNQKWWNSSECPIQTEVWSYSACVMVPSLLLSVNEKDCFVLVFVKKYGVLLEKMFLLRTHHFSILRLTDVTKLKLYQDLGSPKCR